MRKKRFLTSIIHALLPLNSECSPDQIIQKCIQGVGVDVKYCEV